MNLISTLLVISCLLSGSQASPILEDIANFLAGIRYVPPNSGQQQQQQVTERISLSYPSSEQVFQPVPSSSVSESEINSNVVFNRSGGWLEPAGSPYLYLLGLEAASFYETRYWCQEQGGHMAEIYSDQQMKVVRSLLQRDVTSNYWLGTKKVSDHWLTTNKPRNFSFWVEGEPNKKFSDRCVILQGRKMMRWAGWNCGYTKDGNVKFKALCMKKNELSLSSSNAGSFPHVAAFKEIITVDETETTVTRVREEENKCALYGASLTGNNWMSQHSNVLSAAFCHENCLKTRFCRFWTWRSDSRLCYLKNDDGPIVKDNFSVSGTTINRLGCNRPLSETHEFSQNNGCSCKTDSLDIVSGYIDPRTIGIEKEKTELRLGRVIRHSACPAGQTYVCGDNTIVDSRIPSRPNITECLVYDVRLTVGGHVGVVTDVESGEACHNLCVQSTECVYWTWRGETPTKKCFLLPQETRMVRRQGSASGTVSHGLGCDHTMTTAPAQTREELEVCVCTLDRAPDLVGSGLIDPRLLPEDTGSGSGRIVNEDKCPSGFSRKCYLTKTAEKEPEYEDILSANLDYEEYLAASQPQPKLKSDSGLKMFDWGQDSQGADSLWSEGRQLDKVQVPRSTDQGRSKVSFPE